MAKKSVEAVVSGVDPKRTFFHLVDPTQLDPTFANRIKNFRANGTVAKVNLASAVCIFHCAGRNRRLSQRAIRPHPHRPEIDYLERAFDASSTRFRKLPCSTSPSHDSRSLARSDGKHVLSAYVQFAPFKLKEGNWDSRRHDWDTLL